MTFILYKKKTPGTSELELESAAVGSELDTLFPFRASPWLSNAYLVIPIKRLA